MDNLLRIGKRLIPLEHVALIEPYVPDANSPLQTTKFFKSRIVLLNRDSVLAEANPEEIAEEHSFRVLTTDGVATNPDIRFSVEEFQPAENFTPSKEYLTRLSWYDLDGNSQSKLLLTAPEVALSIAVRGDRMATADKVEPGPARPRRRRNAASRAAPKN